MAAATPASALASKNWSSLIKQLDAALNGAPDGFRLQLLLNRGFCLQQLGLFRKALKDYEAALQAHPGHPAALLNKAKVHVALKQQAEAQGCLAELAGGAALTADLAALLEGQLLAAALAAGEVKEGCKLPLLPTPVPPPPPPSPAPQKPTGLAAGFLAKPAAPAATAAPSDSAREAAAAAPPTPAASPSTSSGQAPPSAAVGQSGGPDGGGGGGSGPAAKGQVDPLHRLVATSSDPNQGIALAVNLVNAAKHADAVALLDLLLRSHPGSASGHAARGTAKAFLGDLEGAVADFSTAVQLDPGVADYVKRRGQALAALDEVERAEADLRRAVELLPDSAAKAEVYEDLARLHQKRKDYRRAEAELRTALELTPGKPSSVTLCALGLVQVSQGDLEEGIATYEAALKLDPESKDIWLNLGMACKEISWVQRAEQALRKAAQLAKRGGTAVHAYRLLAHMKQGLGDHLGAVEELNRGIAAAATEVQRIELRFLRGACHHALGLHLRAVEDYQQTLEAQDALGPAETASPELVSFICLAFYQKEMALYVRAHLDRPLLSFCVDADLHPEFKELWCKKGPPSMQFVSMYRAIMQPQHPDWGAPKPPPPPPELLRPLLEAADAVGRLVQYSHQGFLPNRRQQRMAGLAAIEFAQALQQLAADRRAGRTTMVDNAGASVSARRGACGCVPGSHAYGWRDAMDVIVRWRQLAEPNDQVIWVDLLTEREFTAGFGSHTPMYTGQTKCVRYYMVFDRALAVIKRVLAADRRATDADNAPVELDTEEKLAAVQAATTAEDLWHALGTDSWAVVPIQSSTRPGHSLEGTRLTVVNMSKGPAGAAEDGAPAAPPQQANGGGAADPAAAARAAAKKQAQPDAYEFSIRTPVTPARWEDYDAELGGLFERLVAALAAGDLAGLADAALRFAYYWYNFMPLARGSALCGYVSLLGAFLAAGAPVRASMPEHYQTDWEAILESQPSAFIASVSAWMLPPELAAAAAAAPPPPCPPVEQLPKVIELLPTMRARLEALNGPRVPRI